MQRRSNDVARALKRKGFAEEISGHHVYYWYVTEDGLRSAVNTRISHGGSHDIGDTLLGLMAKQCKLPKRHFVELVDCTLDQPGYEKILRDDRHIL